MDRYDDLMGRMAQEIELIDAAESEIGACSNRLLAELLAHQSNSVSADTTNMCRLNAERMLDTVLAQTNGGRAGDTISRSQSREASDESSLSANDSHVAARADGIVDFVSDLECALWWPGDIIVFVYFCIAIVRAGSGAEDQKDRSVAEHYQRDGAAGDQLRYLNIREK